VAAILLAASETSRLKELCTIIQRDRTAVFDQLEQAQVDTHRHRALSGARQPQKL